ncbi:FdtA/QdtA family cupin domain-containing protein [Synechococcus sp. CS-1324]|uniref:sugar 3,4-ketoisomerase n=1 Tax=Synechococcus sp. CS-1324 TaxID=2847980 RepID=UPI000DB69464|nr:FdtA/QdtA family cupin domain-containing protein [Synechococcus sp. CS-1324]MCT0231707.1 FdtA/QdtA family cupin domain-containing protein [Synechococcus sp. CS-1324]PZV04034.1 MAG: hypothetical protein DCF23_07565 [Cyanobium sp.]
MPSSKHEVNLIKIPGIFGDSGEGMLSVLEASELLPFCIERIFTVVDMAKGKRRGGHANTLVNEAICCLRGSLRISTLTRHHKGSHTLTDPTTYLIIPSHTWTEIEALQDGTCYLVVADHSYQEAAPCYVRNLDDFNVMSRAE